MNSNETEDASLHIIVTDPVFYNHYYFREIRKQVRIDIIKNIENSLPLYAAHRDILDVVRNTCRETLYDYEQ